MDVEKFVEQNVKDLVDWEKNFKAIKIRGRDAEKLPKFIFHVFIVYLQNICNFFILKVNLLL